MNDFRNQIPCELPENPQNLRLKALVQHEAREHSHYFKNVEHLKTIDVYRVLRLFNVTDPCLQHALKKLLVAGGRGGGKDISRDVKEAIDTLKRWQEIEDEDAELIRG